MLLWLELLSSNCWEWARKKFGNGFCNGCNGCNGYNGCQEEGRRKFGNGFCNGCNGCNGCQEEGKNGYSCICDFRVLDTGNWELVRPFDYAQEPRSGRPGTA
ncbi:hypothetical protein [Microcoleus sp. D2_18a_D3]|uniref:hypothetical protein n=1 Tax=Microcoleus sp. D2_18a_D3 TaxID=3055330 RepID=UPI002FD2937A